MTQADNIPTRVSNLEESLNRFADFVLQNQRDQQVQQQFQQAQINALIESTQTLNRNQINLTEAMHELAYAVQETRTEMREMQAEMREMQAEIRDIRADMREMRSDIRGMQIEQGRILDVLLNQQRPPDAEP